MIALHFVKRSDEVRLRCSELNDQRFQTERPSGILVGFKRCLANGLVAESAGSSCSSGSGATAERDDLLAKIAAKKGA